jgi:3-oxoacyl-(acyl-carrier-protein) synthase
MAGPNSTSYNPRHYCSEDTLNALTLGNFNMVVGATGLQFLITGNSNVAVGAALSYITTGGSNICIRVGVGSNYNSSESNNIIIGTNVAGTIGESDVM